MTERDARERDILVAANEYAYVQDLTKGDIVLYVGPTKISLSNTERIVELRGPRFLPVRADDPSFGVNAFVTATSSQYIVLENPAKDGIARAPLRGSNASVELLVGRKIVVLPTETGYVRKAWRFPRPGGLHVRVTKTNVAEPGDALPPGTYAAGTDVFLTDRDGFFFPSENVEVLDVILPIPIAEKEGIYVRESASGRIRTVVGPTTTSPIPRASRSCLARSTMSASASTA